MIVIISDDKREDVGFQLYNYFKNSKEDVEFISASGRNIKPCYGCNIKKGLQ